MERLSLWRSLVSKPRLMFAPDPAQPIELASKALVAWAEEADSEAERVAWSILLSTDWGAILQTPKYRKACEPIKEALANLNVNSPRAILLQDLLLNQLLRFRKGTPVCALCLGPKEPDECDSHIFSQCLLLTLARGNSRSPLSFWDTLGNREGVPTAAKDLTRAVLCRSCDNSGSHSEGCFKALLHNAMLHHDKLLSFRNGPWLLFAVGSFFFRGTFCSVDLRQEWFNNATHATLIYQVQLKLRRFLYLGMVRRQVVELGVQVRQFLLPYMQTPQVNGTNKINRELLCPKYPVLCVSPQAAGLYMSFQCFHWVINLVRTFAHSSIKTYWCCCRGVMY